MAARPHRRRAAGGGIVLSAVVALILAAGASHRLGRPKALIRLPGGDTLLTRAVQAARGAGTTVFVTVSPGRADVVAAAGETGATLVEVPDADSGMSASLRAGVSAAQACAADALLVLLVDQWRVETADLLRLLAAWREDTSRVVAAAYAGTVGAPAVFGRAHFGLLATLHGDAGARDYLRDPANGVRTVDLPPAAVDLDLIDDTAALQDRSLGV
ncbi:MAG TPA: nucleotidyltransferase family protein [Tepidisphaeraceae bacterium]